MKNLKYLMVALLIVLATSCKKESPVVEMTFANIEARDIRQQVEGDASKTPLALAVTRKFNTTNVSDDRQSTIIIDGVSYSHISYSLRSVEEVLPDQTVITQIVLTKR